MVRELVLRCVSLSQRARIFKRAPPKSCLLIIRNWRRPARRFGMRQ